MVLSGDTSGTVTVTVPAVAGTNTVTIPASTGTVMVSGNMPAFSAYLPTANQSISSSTWTKVALSAKEFDTANAFDATTNYRFNPQVAGYYQISAYSELNANTANPSSTYMAIYKNGLNYKYARLFGGGSVIGGSTVSAIVYLNGSTDYVEFYVQGVGGTSLFLTYGSNGTYMSGILVRTA